MYQTSILQPNIQWDFNFFYKHLATVTNGALKQYKLIIGQK